jgi:hypothetical protein
VAREDFEEVEGGGGNSAAKGPVKHRRPLLVGKAERSQCGDQLWPLVKDLRDNLFELLDDLLALPGLFRGAQKRFGIDHANVLEAGVEGGGSFGHF